MKQIKSTIDAITDLLFIESPLTKVDLLFVFGHDWIDTMKEVKKLYNKGIASRIIITGHSVNKNRSESEASRFMRKGIELGIPKDIILIEEKATNTKENIEFSIPIIQENIGFDEIAKILFVCKTFHTRRVLMAARNFFPPKIEFYFYPVEDERRIKRDNWWKDSIALSRVLAEVRRIGEYALKGDLSIF